MALSPKQKKIAKMAGDPNKIEGEDFKKLKTMKADEGVGIDIAKKHKKYVKDKIGTVKGYAKEMLGMNNEGSSKKDAVKSLAKAIGRVAVPGAAAASSTMKYLKENMPKSSDPIGIDSLPEQMRSSEILNSKKNKDRLTRADIEASLPSMKNKGGVMKAKYGKMVMARGCKMGRNKPTKLS